MECSVIISIFAMIISLIVFYFQFVQGPNIRCDEINGMHECRQVDDGKRCRILQHLIFVNGGNRTGVVKDIDVKVDGGIREKKYLRSSNQDQKRKIEVGELSGEMTLCDAISDVPPIVGVKPKEAIYRFFEAIILFNGEKITYHIEIETEKGIMLNLKPIHISLKEHTLTIKELVKLEKDPESEPILEVWN